MSAAQPVNRIERRKLEFRRKITDAAVRLFEQNGVADTSIASIIKEADIAHKTFFNHFPTKDHLLRHVASTFSHRAYQSFSDEIARIKDPKKRVAFCLKSIAKELEGVKDHYKELLNLYLISGAAESDLQREQRAQFTSLISQIIAEAREQDQLKLDFPNDMLTDIIIGLCISTLLSWSLEDNYPIVEKMRNQVNFINTTIFV
ncbi:TetR/AcrR family transcriptional regulator [Litorivivens sp.]|uniref:TetR/AcrR family transcriptional regulator n=1 Tax=Litorivivens sp. TaxID=2020868 RepID=UPI003566FA69